MRKKKAVQEDRISRLEKVVSQLYIRQVQLYQKIEEKEKNEVIDDLNIETKWKVMGKIILKSLRYAYTEETNLIDIYFAKTKVDYFLDEEMTIRLLVADGEVNKKHFRRHRNTSEEAIKNYFGSSESMEHLNAKRQIKINNYIDINNTRIQAHSVALEVHFKETNNYIDAVIYDSSGTIIMGVEIAHTNPKNEEKINQLQLLNINIYEKYTYESTIKHKRDRFICFRNYDRETARKIEELEILHSKFQETNIREKQDVADTEYENRDYKKRIKKAHKEIQKIKDETRELEESYRSGNKIEEEKDWYLF